MRLGAISTAFVLTLHGFTRLRQLDRVIAYIFESRKGSILVSVQA